MKKIYEIIHSKDKGQVIVLVAISLIVIFALAALAIDVGISYSIKAKLNAAVDGACSRGRARCETGHPRIATGKTTHGAQPINSFTANYPSDYMNSTYYRSGPTTTVVPNTDGSWTISVNAKAIPPLYFARAVGWSTLMCMLLPKPP